MKGTVKTIKEVSLLKYPTLKIGLLLTGMTLLVFAVFYGQSILYYKKGIIKLEADPQFGRNENWELHIRDERQDLLVLPDGTIYIASALDHCVQMFDKTGKFIRKFGQQGQGPGDLTNPGSLSFSRARKNWEGKCEGALHLAQAPQAQAAQNKSS